uniref:Uncharacterized protein n=1 Tax=Rhizophora mucronata TaxID=61149 RepID=A0A2P2NXU8_RHIMU
MKLVPLIDWCFVF